MASIFLSWGAPDREPVLRLRDRLTDLGLQVWEYSDDMQAGSQVHDKILDVINQVRMAIICFSDETAERKWIETEASWCYQVFKNQTHPLKHILPVWVGPHPQNKIPAVLRDTQFAVSDLSSGSEESLRRLVRDIFQRMGREAPRTVPAALFAMTLQQFQGLFQANPPQNLANLCRALGMPIDLLPFLASRFGDTPEDLAPFQPGLRLVDSIQRTLREANRWRIRNKRRPVFLRWVTRGLVGPGAQDEVRDRWRSGESLLVVDSVSTFHPDLQASLMGMPDLTPRTALLWVPPYTQHVAAQEQTLRSTAGVISRLGDAFRDWEREPRRSIAFDTGTSASLRVWLHRTFDSISDQEEPDESLRESVQEEGSYSLRDYFTPVEGPLG